MRLRVSRTSSDERLTHLLAAGYRILQGMQNAKRDGLFVRTEHDALVSTWGSEVLQALLDIFPTDLENNGFNNADFRRTYFSGPDHPFQEAKSKLGVIKARGQIFYRLLKNSMFTFSGPQGERNKS
jgi:hypothetical protein